MTDPKIIAIDAQIQHALFYSQYWLTMANTGACNLRNVKKWATAPKQEFASEKGPGLGLDRYEQVPLTPEEKAKEALDTAERFQKQYQELVGTKLRLIHKGDTQPC
jgi:hypothetical protein